MKEMCTFQYVDAAFYCIRVIYHSQSWDTMCILEWFCFQTMYNIGERNHGTM